MNSGWTYSSVLQCAFSGVRVLRDGELAFDLAEPCSMSGAIQIAEKVMPSVYRIETFINGEPDTIYFLNGRKWLAA